MLPDGRLDPSFGNNGRVSTDLTRRQPKEVYSSTLQTLALQPDGQIVATGTAAIRGPSGSQIGVAAARYQSNGRLDTTFGTGGWVVTDLPGSEEELLAMTLQPDGKIVLVGGTRVNGDKDGFIVRYTRGGVLDTSFNSTGVKYLNLGSGGNDIAFGVYPQGDKLLVLQNGEAAKCSVVLRLLPDGQLDKSFGADRNGIAVLGFHAVGLSMLPDGRILAAHQSSYSVATLTANGVIESANQDAASGTATPSVSESLSQALTSKKKIFRSP